jgi:hypothetical protein
LERAFTLRICFNRKIASIIILILASLSCRTILPSEKADEPGKVLLQDDFSDPSSGWNQVSTDKGAIEYADGVYRILVNEPNLDIWSIPNEEFGNVRIEVDALKVGGDRDNRFGLICRANDQNNFYTFVISSDGYFGVGKIKDNSYQLIGMDALLRSDAIKLGSELNHIRADCIGKSLTLYVNGERLIEVEDLDFAVGKVGLIAGTYDIPGTDIRFDNLVVYGP